MLDTQETGQPSFLPPSPAIGYCNYTATTAPTNTNDLTEGYSVNSVWFDTVLERFYKCIDDAEGAAEWREILSNTSPVDYNQIGSFPTNKLAGRSTSGTGGIEAISVGSGLSLSGGTLSATGGMSIGGAIGGSPTANGVLYANGSGNLANSQKFQFDGNDLTLKNPTPSTAGTTIQNAPYFNFISQQWRSDLNANQEIKFRMSANPNTPTPAPSYLTPKFLLEYYNPSAFDWIDFFSIQQSTVDGLTARYKFGNPQASGWGAYLDVYYDGSVQWKNLSGNPSPFTFTTGGASPSAFPTFASASYHPELRAYFGDRIVFGAGYPNAIGGTYPEGNGSTGTEWVQSNLPITIGGTANPTGYKFEVNGKSRFYEDVEILNTANIILNKNVSSDTQGILDLKVSGTSKIKFNPYDSGTGSRMTVDASPFILENIHSTGQFVFNSLGSYVFRENGDSWFYLTNSQTVGVNTSTPSAKLHVISTTEQFRLGYDVSNYGNITVSSVGAVTFDAVGSGAKFTFADDVELNSGKTLKVGGTQFRGYTTSTGAVSTTELPNDKDWCFHYDSGAVERWLAINLGGKVYGVQLTEI